MPILRLARRVGPTLGMLALASCGHLGIDFEGTEVSGTGAGPTDDGTVPNDSGVDGTDAAGGSDPGSNGGTGSSAGGTGAATGGSAATGGAADSGGTTGSGSESGCDGHDEVDFSLAGWAMEDGGTSGGDGGDTVYAWNGSVILEALADKDPNTPLTIFVVQEITPNNTGVDKLNVENVEDVSIIGQGTQGVFNGIGLRIINARNIVIRNLTIHHVSGGEGDAIGIAGPADHIWVDHCELYANFEDPEGTYDGLIDIKNDVEYVTYSWNYIHDTWDPILVGATETDTTDRKLTMHHNLIENCDSGPSFRAGSGHFFNNVYRDLASIGINSRLGACIRVENSVFDSVKNPWATAYSDPVGGVELVCNEVDDASIFDGEDPAIAEAPACEASVPYDYSSVLNDVASVADIVAENAGVGALDDPGNFRGPQRPGRPGN